MKEIDMTSTATQARTLPPVGEVVRFYNREGTAFFGVMELNQWFRPIFYAIRCGTRYRLDYVPKGWDNLEEEHEN